MIETQASKKIVRILTFETESKIRVVNPGLLCGAERGRGSSDFCARESRESVWERDDFRMNLCADRCFFSMDRNCLIWTVSHEQNKFMQRVTKLGTTHACAWRMSWKKVHFSLDFCWVDVDLEPYIYVRHTAYYSTVLIAICKGEAAYGKGYERLHAAK